jgi:hypothetical protein
MADDDDDLGELVEAKDLLQQQSGKDEVRVACRNTAL